MGFCTNDANDSAYSAHGMAAGTNQQQTGEEVVVFTFDLVGSRSLQKECPDIWSELTIRQSSH